MNNDCAWPNLPRRNRTDPTRSCLSPVTQAIASSVPVQLHIVGSFTSIVFSSREIRDAASSCRFCAIVSNDQPFDLL